MDLFNGRAGNSLCPVMAMLRFLDMRGIDDGPLLREQNRATPYQGQASYTGKENLEASRN